jgi:hypothetical protein
MLLKPLLQMTDTIGDAFDHMETFHVAGISVAVDRNHTYDLGEAELRRYIAQHGRQAMYTRLGVLVPNDERRAA